MYITRWKIRGEPNSSGFLDFKLHHISRWSQASVQCLRCKVVQHADCEDRIHRVRDRSVETLL